MSTITMTWPQYRRRECRYKGYRTRLTRQQAELLLALLLRGPQPTSEDVLADVLWGDDPDGGPDNPRDNIAVTLHRLRGKLPGAIRGRKGFGWYLEQEPGSASAA